MNWTARITGGLAVAFFGIFVLPEGVSDLVETRDFQFRSMILLLAFTAFSYFFALFRPKEGGIAMVLAGIVMGLNMFYHDKGGQLEPALIYGLPFLIPGLLFWLAGRGE